MSNNRTYSNPTAWTSSICHSKRSGWGLCVLIYCFILKEHRISTEKGVKLYTLKLRYAKSHGLVTAEEPVPKSRKMRKPTTAAESNQDLDSVLVQPSGETTSLSQELRSRSTVRCAMMLLVNIVIAQEEASLFR